MPGTTENSSPAMIMPITVAALKIVGPFTVVLPLIQ